MSTLKELRDKLDLKDCCIADMGDGRISIAGPQGVEDFEGDCYPRFFVTGLPREYLEFMITAWEELK